MKNKQNSNFNIDINTMRELSNTETNEVGGGTLSVITTIVGPISPFTIFNTGNGDRIFDDGFDERP